MRYEGTQKRAVSRVIVLFALALPLIAGAAVCKAADEALPLVVVPAQVNIDTMGPGSTRALEFVVTSTSEKPIRLVYIYAQCDCSLTLSDRGVVPAMGQFVLHAQLAADNTGNEQIDELITILTDHPLQTELTIPVSAWITENKPGTTKGTSGG